VGRSGAARRRIRALIPGEARSDFTGPEFSDKLIR
jgi:hypothetical protein